MATAHNTHPIHVTTVTGRSYEVCAADHTAASIAAELETAHGFRKGVKIMQQNRILHPEDRVDLSVPVLAVGTTVTKNGPRRSPSISPSRHQHRSSAEPANSSSPGAHHSIAVTVLMVIGDGNKTHIVHLPADATVGDLVAALLAKEPSVHGLRLVFCGHELDDVSKELRQYGVRHHSVVHVVPRQLDHNTLQLMDIDRRVKEMEAEVSGASGAVGVDERRRKWMHEECMKMLFSLDGLEELSDDARARRKQLVRHLQAFQDQLLGSHDADA